MKNYLNLFFVLATVIGAINGQQQYKTETVCNDENVEKKVIDADIVFVFDESASMCPYINALRDKLQDFIDGLKMANANARFALIGFGGYPRIYSGFTEDSQNIKSAFDKLNCNQGGQESGLEAIRMFLKQSTKFINKIEDVRGTDSFTEISKLEWRPNSNNSTRTIILVTDEDSDLPRFPENRNDLQNEAIKNYIDVRGSYNGKTLESADVDKFMGFPYYMRSYDMPKYSEDIYFEPSFGPVKLASVYGVYTFYRTGSPLVLGAPYQKEVDDTAELLIKDNVQLFMLLNDDLAEAQTANVANSQFDNKNPYFVKNGLSESDDSSTITAQYGNPFIDNVSNDAYESEDIYKKLVERKQEKSLQGQILNSKGFCRAFNMKDFVRDDSKKMVELFYKTIIETIQQCETISTPIEEPEEPSPNKTVPIVIGAVVGSAAVAAIGAAYFKGTARRAGNQLANNVFTETAGIENPLYNGVGNQNVNPLYEANLNYDENLV